MSGFVRQISSFFLLLLDGGAKVGELVIGGSVINGAYSFYFFCTVLKAEFDGF